MKQQPKTKQTCITALTHARLLRLRATINPQPKIGALLDWIVTQHLDRAEKKTRAAK